MLAVCACVRIDSWQFVDKHYRMNVYGCCYAPKFNPIPHQTYWPIPNFSIVHPNPTLLHDRGRPRSSRIRKEMNWREPSAKVKCGFCKQEGHNPRKCPKIRQTSNTPPQ